MTGAPENSQVIGHEKARVRVVLVSGLSGAGKSSALNRFEDLGWEVVDNLPLNLLQRLLTPRAHDTGEAVAVGLDIRSRGFSPESFVRQLEELRRRRDIELSLLFFDCNDEVLHRRFTETRRRHPLAGDRPVIDGITRERELMAPIRNIADLVIDSSNLALPDLNRLIAGHFSLESVAGLTLSILSFSFRQGLPREADLVFDVRFLNNPHYDAKLRPHTGKDADVGAFIRKDPAFAPFFESLKDMLLALLPHYQREGKSYLTIAFGCTGGRHRSVFLAESMAKLFAEHGYRAHLRHRDLQDG